MTQSENHGPQSESTVTEIKTVPLNLRQRLTSIAAVAILIAIFGTPVIGFLWLRKTVIREAEWNALWHTQTMIIHHLARTHGEWPRSWDDLEADFQPTNKSHRTDSTETLHEHVEVDFDLDLQEIVQSETDDPPLFISLKSGRLEAEEEKVNVQLREQIKKSLQRWAH